MRRWIIALALGLVVIGAVYLLREQLTREAEEAVPPAEPALERAATATKPGAEPQAPADTAPSEETAALPETEVLPAEEDAADTSEARTTAGSVTVNNAWARESTPLGTTAVYMFVIPDEKVSDRLIGARSTAAQSVEIHESRAEGNVMTMSRINGVDIEAGAPIEFEPGGLHLMVIGLKRPLKKGDTLPLELVFARAGTMKLNVPVGEPSETDPLGHGAE